MNAATRPLVPLGEFMLEGGSSVDPAKRPNDHFVLYSIPSFDEGRPEVLLGREIGSPKKKVQPGDVLLSRIVPHIRRGWIVEDHAKADVVASGEWIVFRSNKIDAPYLRHFLVSDVFHPRFMKTVAGVGGSLLRAKPSYVAEIPIPLPPLDEQRRIAAILDKADDLRRKRERAIELLDGLTQSIFLEMFGNPESNPKNWPLADFGSIITNENNKRIPVKSADRDQRDGSYPYYGASGIIDHIDEYLFDGRRLLIAEDGANLLSRSTPIAFFAEGKFWVNNHAHVLAEGKNCNLTYLRSHIEAIDLAPYVTGSAQPKLNRANLDRIPVPVPPIETQKAFESRVDYAAKLASDAAKAAVVSDNLFVSLQHRAFSGQL